MSIRVFFCFFYVGGGVKQEVQERQQKRQQAKAERLGADDMGMGRETEQRATAAFSAASGVGEKGGKKPLGCNSCGLTFGDTVRT